MSDMSVFYFLLQLFLQGTVGPRGAPGSRGPPGEGLPGPKVSAPNHNRPDNQHECHVKFHAVFLSGRPRVAGWDWCPRRAGSGRPRTQGKLKFTLAVTVSNFTTVNKPNLSSGRSWSNRNVRSAGPAWWGWSPRAKGGFTTTFPNMLLVNVIMQTCVWLFRVRQVLQVQGGWRGYLG